MRFRRMRARIAAALKDRSDSTRSASQRKNFLGAIRRIFPLEGKVPKGQVFIPLKQLEPEARDAIDRLRHRARTQKIFFDKMNQQRMGAGAIMAIPSLFIISGILRQPYGSIMTKTGIALTLALTSVGIVAQRIYAGQSKQKADLNFLSGYMQKVTTPRLKRLRQDLSDAREPKYNFFMSVKTDWFCPPNRRNSQRCLEACDMAKWLYWTRRRAKSFIEDRKIEETTGGPEVTGEEKRAKQEPSGIDRSQVTKSR